MLASMSTFTGAKVAVKAAATKVRAGSSFSACFSAPAHPVSADHRVSRRRGRQVRAQEGGGEEQLRERVVRGAARRRRAVQHGVRGRLAGCLSCWLLAWLERRAASRPRHGADACACCARCAALIARRPPP
jgi:hypothetical protein